MLVQRASGKQQTDDQKSTCGHAHARDIGAFHTTNHDCELSGRVILPGLACGYRDIGVRMSFWSKLFGTGVETVPAGPTAVTPVPWASPVAVPQFSEEPQPVPAGVADLASAKRLAADHRWSEALAMVEDIHALPQDIEAAKHQLRALIKEQAQSGQNTTTTGPDKASAAAIDVLRAKLGGSSVSDLMALRAQCLTKIMAEMVKNRAGSPGFAGTSDPEFAEFTNKALAHVELTSTVLNGDAENLAHAAGLCHSLARFQQAHELLQRVVALAPDNAMAAAMLKMTEKRMAEFPGR